MKKILFLLIIPFLSFGQDCDLEDLTYVPDDNFENWIETNYPQAVYGGNNDYVLTAGLDFGGEEGLDIGNLVVDGPIFDLTGIEDFRGITGLTVGGLLVENLDLSCIQLQNNSLGLNNWQQAPMVNISGCGFLENLTLPSDTFQLIIASNSSLTEVVFQPDAHYTQIRIGSGTYFNDNLCYINIRGNDWSNGSNEVLDINQPLIIDLFEFNSEYGSSASFYDVGWWPNQEDRDFHIRFNPEVYDWTSVTLYSLSSPLEVNEHCVEVSDPSYCELYWNDVQDAFNYSTNCWSPTDNGCGTVDIIELNTISKPLLKKIDILGRETTNNKGFQLLIYDDGTVEKKYLIK